MVFVEGSVGLLLIAVLVALGHFRSRLLAISRRGYLSISWGFSLLAITGMIRLAREVGALATVPFVADPIIFNLFCAIALITGITLVGSGVFVIVSVLVERNRSERESWAHLFVIKQIEQLAQVEHRLDNLLQFALEQFASGWAVSRGAVIKISPCSGKIAVVGSVGEVQLDDSEWLTLSRADHREDRTVVPVKVHNRTVALFALWRDGQSDRNSLMIQSMHVVAAIIARKIEQDELNLFTEYLGEKNRIRRELEQELAGQTELPAAVSALTGVLRKYLSTNVVSLLWFQPEQARMSRFTAGDSGTLTEYKLPMPDLCTVGGWVFSHGKSMLITDASDKTVLSLDGPFAAAGIKSVMAVPLVVNNSTIGTLILGSRASHAFGQRQLEVVLDCSWSVGRILQEFESNRASQLLQREIERTIQQIAMPINQFGSEEYFGESANLIAREFNWEMVRVCALGNDELFIESLAAAGPAFGATNVPSQGTLVLSLLDRHREVIESGRPFSVMNFEQLRSVSRIELDHVFGFRCRSLQIIPLLFDGRLVGLISLGAITETIHIMSPLEESLLTLLSGNLAIAIARRSGEGQAVSVPSGYTKAVAANKAERELRNRLRSPLTGILGSLELIKREMGDFHDRSKYIEIIDKSARRMQKYLEQPESASR